MEKAPIDQNQTTMAEPQSQSQPAFTSPPHPTQPMGMGEPGQPLPQGGYNQPPPPYFPPPISTQPIGIQVVHVQTLGSQSARMMCPHCGADIQTRVKYHPGILTHVAAVLLCLVCIPCLIIPYCMDDCMDAQHDCPNCDRHIGIHRKM
jgi:lipopolysaccharide-induced tumor necrosis factor-alpha factor